MAAGAQLFSPLPSVLDGTASTRRPHNGRDDILKLRAWQTWKMIAYVDLSDWLPKTLKNSREIESKQDLEWYKTTKSCWDIWVCLKIEELPQNCHGLSARSSSSHIYNYVGCLPFLHKPIPSRNLTICYGIYIYGKSPLFIGKPSVNTINVPFSIAKCWITAIAAIESADLEAQGRDLIVPLRVDFQHLHGAMAVIVCFCKSLAGSHHYSSLYLLSL